MEWTVSSSVDSSSYEKVRVACVELSKYHGNKYPAQVVVMAAAGILRGLSGNSTVRAAADLRSLVEGTIVSIAMGLIPTTEKFDLGGYGDDDDDNRVKVLLQFVALGLARIGPCSFHPSLDVCLAVSLMAEAFPLPIYYRRAIGNSLAVEEVGMHCSSSLFRGQQALLLAPFVSSMCWLMRRARCLWRAGCRSIAGKVIGTLGWRNSGWKMGGMIC